MQNWWVNLIEFEKFMIVIIDAWLLDTDRT
jgi:hypothetical protein